MEMGMDDLQLSEMKEKVKKQITKIDEADKENL